MKGKRLADDAAHAERMSLAWHIEAFARSKRLPKLKQVIGKQPSQPQRQSQEEMLANMRAWVQRSNQKRG